MEYIAKPQQKLSLSSPFNKLHTALWEQKKKNCFLQKQNIVLNTKISSIKQNLNVKTNKNNQNCLRQKQKLKQVYQEINNQQNWIKEAISLIQQKNFDKECRKKTRIQKKLNKTSKKNKVMSKKLQNLQNKVVRQQRQLKRQSKFLGQYEENQQQELVSSQDVLAELQKQNQQLIQLLRFKENRLNEETRKVNSLNSEVIELLALKNYIRKYAAQSEKNSIYTQSVPHSVEKRSSLAKLQKKGVNQIKNITAYANIKPSTTSIFRRQPKLKITTY